MVTIHLQTQFGEDRCTQFSYHGNSPTNKQTKPQTNPQAGPITIHCAAELSAECDDKSGLLRSYVIFVFTVYKPDIITAENS